MGRYAFRRTSMEGHKFADVRWVAQTGSTNADLLALAVDGAPEVTPTTVKLRILSKQQLLRVDFETAPSSEVLASKLADGLSRVNPRQDVTFAVAGSFAEAACSSAMATSSARAIGSGNTRSRIAPRPGGPRRRRSCRRRPRP